jgi:hypothetical protein
MSFFKGALLFLLISIAMANYSWAYAKSLNKNVAHQFFANSARRPNARARWEAVPTST